MPEPRLYDLLLVAWFAAALLTAPVLLFVPAPYGRHRRAGWGPEIPDRLGWALMEAPAALVFGLLYLAGPHSEGAGAAAIAALWEAHYLHRALVYPLRRGGRGRPMPLATVLLGACFNVVNGYLQARGLFALGPGVPEAWLRDPRFICGAALFVAGLALNVSADAALARLRTSADDGYRVPFGPLFRRVSCPNYLGEIIEWCGFALLAWTPAALSFALWTIANLAPRARSHHAWYRREFPSYPEERRALVPFVW